jgi:hypothetical protein
MISVRTSTGGVAGTGDFGLGSPKPIARPTSAPRPARVIPPAVNIAVRRIVLLNRVRPLLLADCQRRPKQGLRVGKDSRRVRSARPQWPPASSRVVVSRRGGRSSRCWCSRRQSGARSVERIRWGDPLAQRTRADRSILCSAAQTGVGHYSVTRVAMRRRDLAQVRIAFCSASSCSTPALSRILSPPAPWAPRAPTVAGRPSAVRRPSRCAGSQAGLCPR